jgi:hypothetical protein
MDTLAFILSDYVFLPLLELCILLVFLRSFVYDIGAKLREGGTGAKVTRKDPSWVIILTFCGLAIVLIDVVISSEIIKDHRIIVGLLNLGVMFYLFFCSVYFKNWLVGIYGKMKNWSQQV